MSRKKRKRKRKYLYMALQDYKLNLTGKILFTKDKVYIFRKEGKYLYRGLNDRNRNVYVSDLFMDKTFRRITDKNEKERLMGYVK